ncbi:MAG: hypothetical protein ABI760_16530 [Ferruginibacter sp.]
MLRKILFQFIALQCSFLHYPGFAQFKETKHRLPAPGEVAVTGPGNYGEPGTTYVLVKNITSPMSTIFLGKDVTLDLNGYILRYADGKYNHIANSGFEEGLKAWNISKAPGAKVVNTEVVHVFVGKKLMSLQAGDEITSSYIYLPVSNRSYIAMCGVTGRNSFELGRNGLKEMVVSVFVEDANGKEVKCVTKYMDSTMVSCPVEKRSPQLGGGFVFAHLNNLPAGNYRVRVRADSDCLVDEIDIRPVMDVGIGIIEKTYARGHYDHLYKGEYAAFFDYTGNTVESIPKAGIPRVEGRGTVTIRNGIIENASVGAISWGIQSTAPAVKVIIENIKCLTSGINTIAVDVPQASIINSRFDVHSPFIINRHNSNFYAVDIRDEEEASEVSFSEFFGGQGCLVFKGKKSSIHNNYFVNRQMVTNHYSIMAMGDSSRVFSNRIEPEVGSGIEIFRHRDIDIFDNLIKIRSSPPTCEYGHEEYSTNAIRMADYQEKPGGANACSGNRIYNNKIFITVKNQPKPDNFIPMSYGVYASASGGENYIFGNDIVVNHLDPSSKARAAAFYICGGTIGFGGQFFNNRVTTNVPAAWLATPYGGTVNTRIYNNTITRSANALPDFKPFRMGWKGRDDTWAKDVEFNSNDIRGAIFGIQATDQDHSYSVIWTLQLKVSDQKGNPVGNADITILDKNHSKILQKKTDEWGKIKTELLEYSVRGKEKTYSAPYTVEVRDAKKEFMLNKNTSLTLVTK